MTLYYITYHVTTVTYLFIIQIKKKKRNIKSRKINKRKRKRLVFKYTITYIRVKSFILFSLVKLKRLTTLYFYFFDI